MRAYRPSRFGSPEEQEPDPAAEVARIAKMLLYSKRAEANQPLFSKDEIGTRQVAGKED